MLKIKLPFHCIAIVILCSLYLLAQSTAVVEFNIFNIILLTDRYIDIIYLLLVYCVVGKTDFNGRLAVTLDSC